MIIRTQCFLAALIIALSLAGCGRENSGSTTESSEPVVPPASESSSVSQENTESILPEESADPDNPGDTEVSVDRILMEIEAAYGDDYPADGEIPAEMLESQFGITPDMVIDAKGAMAMISVNNDQVVVAQAAPGRADDVEEALNKARQNKIDDTLQYPANIPKTNAAKVVRHEDFVAFLLVGLTDDNLEDAQSAEAKEYAEQQVQRAVDAFNSVFE